MRLNFIQRFLDPGVSSPAGIDPVSGSIAAAKTIFDIVRTISGDARAKRAMDKRTAYQTPEAIFKLLNATLNQGGGDTRTRDFQTNQIDKNFSQVLGNATRLGANPNNLSALFDQKMNSVIEVGEQFHKSNMEWFSKITSAYNLVADNDAAEQKDRARILDNEIAAAAGEKAAGGMGLVNDANAFIGLQAAAKTSNLYNNDIFKKIAEALGIGSGGGTGVFKNPNGGVTIRGTVS